MDEIDRLGLAAETGDLEEVARLVQAGVPVDAKHSTGRARTALDRAIWAEQTEVVRLLLASGADPDQEIGEYGEDMPVRFAAPRGLVDIMGLLLEAGADPDGRGAPERSTPIALAIGQGLIDVVEVLLDHGAHLEGVQQTGGTPLRAAAAAGQPAIARMLLDRGARATADALELAKERSLKHHSDPARLADYTQVITMLTAATASAACQASADECYNLPPSGDVRLTLKAIMDIRRDHFPDGADANDTNGLFFSTVTNMKLGEIFDTGLKDPGAWTLNPSKYYEKTFPFPGVGYRSVQYGNGLESTAITLVVTRVPEPKTGLVDAVTMYPADA
jgi:hypothetical protein